MPHNVCVCVCVSDFGEKEQLPPEFSHGNHIWMSSSVLMLICKRHLVRGPVTPSRTFPPSRKERSGCCPDCFHTGGVPCEQGQKTEDSHWPLGLFTWVSNPVTTGPRPPSLSLGKTAMAFSPTVKTTSQNSSWKEYQKRISQAGIKGHSHLHVTISPLTLVLGENRTPGVYFPFSSPPGWSPHAGAAGISGPGQGSTAETNTVGRR